MVADHFVPAKDALSAALQKRLKDWATDQGVAFYDQGRGGIEHMVLAEDGWIVPGEVIVGGDSHTCTYGALGAFGSGLGSTDIAAALANGEFWQPVPATIRVCFDGEKRGFVSGKDLILAVIAQIGVGGATNAVLEFVGEGARAAVDRRAHGGGQHGGRGGRGDGPVRGRRRARARISMTGSRDEWDELRSDEDAEVAREVHIDLDALEPLVAAPHSPGNVMALADAVGTPVEQVYIGNCANGTMTDLRQAAEVFRGRSVHSRSRVVIVPATQAIYREALREGLLDTFVAAGAMVSTPTCGACFGGGMGVPAAGETAVTTTNRNFKGRMGSPDASVYLANAYVAAAAAVAGEFIDPGELIEAPLVDAVSGARGGGRDLEDNVDTDVLYPGVVPQHRGPRADEPAPVRGPGPLAARRDGARTRS